MSIQSEHTNQDDFADYFELVKAFPLRPIRHDDQFKAASDVLDQLLDMGDLSEGQQDYLDVLGGLIKGYEDVHDPMPAASGVEVLQFLMEQHSLRQIDLVPVFGSKSVVSEILRGKRHLNLGHILKLSRYFKVPADVFINTEHDEI